jgi:APA family basic amino acid/polyamine antiporter
MTTLQRHLGVGRAIIVGLAAMIGAGVFFVWGRPPRPSPAPGC